MWSYATEVHGRVQVLDVPRVFGDGGNLAEDNYYSTIGKDDLGTYFVDSHIGELFVLLSIPEAPLMWCILSSLGWTAKLGVGFHNVW